MPRPRTNRSARRSELISAAAQVFAQRGVAKTAVSDIVKSAGVAQGTFYLYFDSKDAVIKAVVEQMADGMIAAIEAAVTTTGTTAFEKLMGLCHVLAGFDDDPAATEMADFIHRAENRALHDLLTERLAERLAAIVEAIVAQGIAEGAFEVPDARAAAWFVLGGLQSIELAGTAAAQMPAAIEASTTLALRVLGYKELS